MSTLSRIALRAMAVLLGATLTAPALATDDVTWPRTIGSGENVEIDYGPGPRGNVVGGGAVHVTGSGENVEVHHLDPSFVQQPPAGQVPVTVGSGENVSTVWVPADNATTQLGLLIQPGAARG
ncbi:hypothetical protein [Falsiroseomonas oryziterrae]|uniref:hypothetical protein n=1 Tax=Falsiroseomonas oryziterrae TaxID=2911368 RepID=UPI001F2CC1B6|nr:hypothetical protein [Roseomonas sp. NPKOSM-4]